MLHGIGAGLLKPVAVLSRSIAEVNPPKRKVNMNGTRAKGHPGLSHTHKARAMTRPRRSTPAVGSAMQDAEVLDLPRFAPRFLYSPGHSFARALLRAASTLQSLLKVDEPDGDSQTLILRPLSLQPGMVG